MSTQQQLFGDGSEQSLHQKLTTFKEVLGGDDAYRKLVPGYIYDNLRENWGQRPYQQEAFGRFVFYMEKYGERPQSAPIHLLYQMATGSGKTVIMAGLILYLYEQGYRNFLFFVDSTNIIEKTKDNFLNNTATKYLYDQDIQIGEKRIRIREVDNFAATNQDDINIVFSTIQGLHMNLNQPRENAVTYEDFEDHRTVLISDEAHHINATTKSQSRLLVDEKENLQSWEQTVNRIYNSHQDNILLEFTATANLKHPAIAEKYRDKLIYDYPLKQFRIDGYSKEVKVLQADLEDFERALQAVLLSQFRLKVFSKYGKLIKPVLLFKSKTIKESEAFYDEFIDKVRHIDEDDIKAIRDNTNLDPVLERVFDYMDEHDISTQNMATELREDFSEEKCITVNSKSESEEKQIAVNTLEDPDNEYRAVFAVSKLNEGWDVLNLFDIVRLYNTRDAKAGKPGNTTISEAQLIGRGARYCPFRIKEDQPLYKRKYDVRGAEEEHELKICEELYYHSAYNPRYIDELHTALKQVGIEPEEKRQQQLKLKNDFKQTDLYQKGFIFINEQEKYDREDVYGLPEDFISKSHKHSIATGYTKASVAFETQTELSSERKHKDYHLREFGRHVLRKAMARLDFFKFSTLKEYLPHLKSVDEFISSDQYLGEVKVELSGPESHMANPTQDDKLQATVSVLQVLSKELQKDRVEHKGTKEFTPQQVKDTFKDKTLTIARDLGTDEEYGVAQSETSNEELRLNLSEKDWYAFNENYGTSQEKRLVRYINKVFDILRERYNEVYLVRNERHFKLFNFEDGRALEPDFVLFLIQDEEGTSLHYQIFIEPKGKFLFKTDEWKEEFLLRIQEEHELEQIWKGRHYNIWGMPFFNEEHRQREFEESFEEMMKLY